MPFTPESIEQLFTTSTILHSKSITFTQSQPQIWKILYKQENYTVTFYPDVYDEKPSLRLMNFGEPFFEELLSAVAKFLNTKELTPKGLFLIFTGIITIDYSNYTEL